MQYIIFGAGGTGKKALNFLSYRRVACFADNNPHEPLDEWHDVVSYDKMLEMVQTGGYIIVVASERHNAEMVAQLKRDNIERFFIFYESYPRDVFRFYPRARWYRQDFFVPYWQCLAFMNIHKYKRIAVYGSNYFLPYLLAEISIQNDFSNIVGVVPTEGDKYPNTLGLPTLSLDEVWDKIDCLLVNIPRKDMKLQYILEERKHGFDILDIYNIEAYMPGYDHPELAKYKDIHKGKRCFIIGNGPSLRMEDLDILHEHGEFCFAANRIYLAYAKTKWRANFIFASDFRIIELYKDEFPTKESKLIISDEFHRTSPTKISGVDCVHVIKAESYPYYARFSDDITRCTYGGGTTLYDLCLQFAVYMGFSKIYLLGVDCSYSSIPSADGNHFVNGYYADNVRKKFVHDTTYDISAHMHHTWESAEEYSKSRNFKIYNATRGGALEAFERVDFDSLF